jgi:hypothetical protein
MGFEKIISLLERIVPAFSAIAIPAVHCNPRPKAWDFHFHQG